MPGSKHNEVTVMPEIIPAKLPFRGKDITGQRFCNLTALGYVGYSIPPSGKRVHYWRFKCDCGKETTVLRSNARSGHTTSCGCNGYNNSQLAIYKHGGAAKGSNGKQEKLYHVWRSMIQRCTDPNVRNYYRYGGRGIKVLWKDYSEFRFDMLPTYQDGLTIDRKDNDGHYCKENCKWSTYREQAINTSRTINLTFNGKTQCISFWAKELGMKRATLEQRYHKGWTHEKILTHPLRGRNQV